MEQILKALRQRHIIREQIGKGYLEQILKALRWQALSFVKDAQSKKQMSGDQKALQILDLCPAGTGIVQTAEAFFGFRIVE